MAPPRIGIYPGTFDPIHNGHVDIIRRAALVVDRLIVAVAVNPGKEPLFALDERTAMVEAEIEALRAAGAMHGAAVEAQPFDRLLVRFAIEQGAAVIVRGLRAVSDFEYEFQMALNNKRLAGEVETLFLMASESVQFISSRFVKEIHGLDGDVSSMVSPSVVRRLDERRGRGAGMP